MATKKENRASAKLLKTEPVQPEGFKWVQLAKLTYEDAEGKERQWEMSMRSTRKGDVDGVAVVCRLLKKGEKPKTVLVSQFRPPANAYVLEVPAGLVDEGETAEQAAIRELKEETGFTATRVTHVSPIVLSDPGVSGDTMQYVTVEVDLDAEENLNPKANPEEGEHIDIHIVEIDSLLSVLQDPTQVVQDRPKVVVDARLFGLALSML
ncbi:ADP-sugar pyrophosphatase [Hondaea fermentalgiana]|uniref:ADP-sugar pyrophosphatase n=1 Tax=Hondaea fermentalgiana TaxID=2315210 RepID=A0A2R5GEH6_9STRA|nr:ADP-sugar pyrophosphatase [Hondaea fermentalgiana]|eukprot:GBG29347.1 ADP-sugar pyrophosphatase [Hondaea fermentalgiana]